MRKAIIWTLFLLISGITCIVLLYPQKEIVQRNYPVKGVDVSHYQKVIDWRSVSQSGISFVFVKATEGMSLKDKLFDRNWERIKREGLRRGAYHFFRPSISAENQASHFIESVALEIGDFPPVLDVEVRDGVSKKELLMGIHAWLVFTEMEYGVKPILYTNQNFYNKYLKNEFTGYPLWIARYGLREPRLKDNAGWTFWQYSSTGQIEGIEGKTDFNVYSGSLEELNQFSLQPREILR
jgi:lysozyme